MSGSFFWLLLEILDTETGLIQVKEQCCHTESQFMHPILCACSSGCVHVPAAGQPGSTGGCAVGGIPGGKSCWKNNNKKPFVRHFLYKQFIRFKQWCWYSNSSLLTTEKRENLDLKNVCFVMNLTKIIPQQGRAWCCLHRAWEIYDTYMLQYTKLRRGTGDYTADPSKYLILVM